MRARHQLRLLIGFCVGACGGDGDPGPRAGGQIAEPPSETPPTSSAQPELRPGRGSCKTDDDCVAAHSIDPGHYGAYACCIRFCPPAPALSRALFEQESRWKEKSCSAAQCGIAPPAPCRKQDFDLIPRCVAGACASEVRKRAPRPAPDL
ncbi:MAG: hypothetical protein IPM79_25530 [Polyangiaceae bacterium]|nr:hypothetical protein [Polyangiaceae bacterium]MBK8940887.1 hypothetical protein [Polyangiaceae bacterium]